MEPPQSREAQQKQEPISGQAAGAANMAIEDEEMKRWEEELEKSVVPQNLALVRVQSIQRQQTLRKELSTNEYKPFAADNFAMPVFNFADIDLEAEIDGLEFPGCSKMDSLGVSLSMGCGMVKQKSIRMVEENKFEEVEEEPPYRMIPIATDFLYEPNFEPGVDRLDNYIYIHEVIGKGGFCKVKRVRCEIIDIDEVTGEEKKLFQNLAVKMYNKASLRKERIFKTSDIIGDPLSCMSQGPQIHQNLSFNKMMTGLDLFYQGELELWQRCAHENIVKIFELYDHINEENPQHRTNYMYLLMQYADFGTLGDCSESEDGKFRRNTRIYERVREHLVTNGDAHLKQLIIKQMLVQVSVEDVARHIFKQIAEGLRYLHNDLMIAHRDIKPENIMYFTEMGGGLLPEGEKDDSSKDRVKIGDFTVAIEVKADDMYIQGNQGTEAFLPPEVTDPSILWYMPRPLDIWALGVTLYAYLFEALPFFDTREDYKYKLDLEDRTISQECKDLLNGLLDLNPRTRLTIIQVINHPWFKPPQPSTELI